MDGGLSNNSSSFREGGNGRSDEAEAPSRSSSGSWSFRSNSFPRNSFSGDSSSGSGKSGPAAWARNIQSWTSTTKDSQSPKGGAKSGFSLFSNIGFHKQTTVKIPVVEAPVENTGVSESFSVDNGPLNTLKTGLLNTSRSAVKAVQTKARHMVSQNKRRYQEGGFDLDLSYITENIIAMGFPAGDMSSGIFGYFEGFYRNHMEEVIKFLETQHKGKHKVYNLCSERLYDAALFQGKVACFPFDDHNCPQLQLISEFCRSAYSWLKGDLENVVVVHCKAGMARTGLMISCLLLYLKFFPTSEESIAYYNQKRCIDGKGLVLPSQLRYVKYFERVLRDFNGETPKGRKCILRGIRLHRCPYWIRPAITILDHNGVLFSSKKHPRTKDMMSEDIWFAAPRKGVMVFALPGERCIADLNGDFKVLFTDRQGDFYCWLNTNMMESRQILLTSDLDGFDKRRLPSPGFQVEVVILDHDAPVPAKSKSQPLSASAGSNVPRPPQAPQNSNQEPSVSQDQGSGAGQETVNRRDGERDSIFSDSEGEDDKSSTSKNKRAKDKAVKHHSAGADGDVQGVGGLTSSNSFSMSSTLGDGLRNAMDRIGISQAGRTGRVDGGSSHPSVSSETTSHDIKPPLTGRLPDSPDKSSNLPSGGDAGHPDGPVLHPPHDPVSEQSVGRPKDSLDVKQPERGSKGNLRDLEVKSQSAGPERFESSVPASDFSATVASAADASVFTFGDEDDFESEEE